ncbi:DUF4276 family protein [Nocardiopsis sp. RSe5-2]|uniref:DUF4276 family protein n=1 Tax=Nocardiopsis endophytica TaxID=3018445 RepID=A0ABT4U445_9ACTN|nr:DUF4276 family protein [Nocardiopsis endophytica]MDA2811705.1 DUF4276 family protein [Nocardiopsis endophytica]
MSPSTGPRRIATIVEGHGGVEAVPVLLWRLAAELAPGAWVDFPSPHRIGRDSLVKPGGIEAAVDQAARRTAGVSGVLALFDADDDCPASLGPELTARGESALSGIPCAVVLAKREFEAWFLASASSLRGRQGLPDDLEPPAAPEEPRDCKGWISEHRTDGRPYKPKIHQPGLAAAMNLAEARAHSPSFDKFCRDVAALISPES